MWQSAKPPSWWHGSLPNSTCIIQEQRKKTTTGKESAASAFLKWPFSRNYQFWSDYSSLWISTDETFRKLRDETILLWQWHLFKGLQANTGMLRQCKSIITHTHTPRPKIQFPASIRDKVSFPLFFCNLGDLLFNSAFLDAFSSNFKQNLRGGGNYDDTRLQNPIQVNKIVSVCSMNFLNVFFLKKKKKLSWKVSGIWKLLSQFIQIVTSQIVNVSYIMKNLKIYQI